MPLRIDRTDDGQVPGRGVAAGPFEFDGSGGQGWGRVDRSGDPLSGWLDVYGLNFYWFRQIVSDRTEPSNARLQT